MYNGGIVLTLAVTAFSYDCNSSNFIKCCSSVQYHYPESVLLGENLTTYAHEILLIGNNETYIIKFKNHEKTITLFSEHSKTLQEQIIKNGNTHE